MRKKTWKKVVSLGLAIVTASMCFLGCAKEEETVTIKPMEKEEVDTYSLNVIGGDDVMPVGAFWGPTRSIYSVDGQSLPEYINDQYFKDMADCGVNLMLYSTTTYGSSPAEVKKMLDFGEKYKIGIVVNDSTVRNAASEGEVNMEELTNRLAEYMNHPGFAGCYLVDEPYTSTFRTGENKEQNINTYEKIGPLLNQELGLFTYVNLLSSILSQKDMELFESYLRECLDVMQPHYLLYDRYPFDEAQDGMIDRYFYDLAVARKVADDYNIPFWTFIQAGSQWNDSMGRFDSEGYYPSEGEFDWNINTCLAFGAKGLSYFPYIQPYYFAYAASTDFDFERNGMIGAWGNKNRWYYYAQEISKQIQLIDEVLMNSVSKGVLACGAKAAKDLDLTADQNVLLEGDSWRELKSVTGDALIGCFNYQGRTALYVVNYSMEYAQKIDLAFHNSYKVTVMQNGETRDLKGKGMTLDLLAGEGVLLVFE